jgi:hypothetical protein
VSVALAEGRMCLCRPWCRANRAALLLIDQTASWRLAGGSATLQNWAGWRAGFCCSIDSPVCGLLVDRA